MLVKLLSQCVAKDALNFLQVWASFTFLLFLWSRYFWARNNILRIAWKHSLDISALCESNMEETPSMSQKSLPKWIKIWRDCVQVLVTLLTAVVVVVAVSSFLFNESYWFHHRRENKQCLRQFRSRISLMTCALNNSDSLVLCNQKLHSTTYKQLC